MKHGLPIVHDLDVTQDVTPIALRRYPWRIRIGDPSGGVYVQLSQLVDPAAPELNIRDVEIDGAMTALSGERIEVFDCHLVSFDLLERFAEALVTVVAEARARHPELANTIASIGA